MVIKLAQSSCSLFDWGQTEQIGVATFSIYSEEHYENYPFTPQSPERSETQRRPQDRGA